MSHTKHFVAIFGGAVSGAEAASQFAQRGIRVAVFEQNALPYGKIEDGLPKWHVKLRDKEEGRINEKLNHPLVSFVPNTRLGSDLDLKDLAENWGFSALVLATGAWKDRPLPIDGIEAFVNKGLYYQNPFIYWFNHYHQPDYSGQTYEISDGAVVVGGGLASIDVAKALMMVTVQNALLEKGHQVDLFQLDRSITKVLDGLGLTLSDLGLKGCTIFYRRRIKDMPLSSLPTDTPEKLAKAQMVREKILNNAKKKYLFNIAPLRAPVGEISENGRLTGLVFQKTKVENGKVIPIPDSEVAVKTPLVISSIGSIPEPIPGIPMKWQTYQVHKEEYCRIEGYDKVFAIGNAVTGRGNIVESLKHGREISQKIAENYLRLEADNLEAAYRKTETMVGEQSKKIAAAVQTAKPLTNEMLEDLENRVAAAQKRTGYDGNYENWIEKHLPKRLENLIGKAH